MNPWLISLILLIHWLADFPLQLYPWGSWMALSKSRSWKALLCHTLAYSCCFLWLGLWFSIVTFLTHTITDAITSRLTSKLWFVRIIEPRNDGLSYDRWNMKSYAPFFTVIGLDQLIHVVTLLWTLKLLS